MEFDKAIAELEAEIESKRAELESARVKLEVKVEILADLKRRFSSHASHLKTDASQKVSMAVVKVEQAGTQAIDVSQLPASDVGGKRAGFAEDVRAVVGRFGMQEFVVGHVIAVLKKEGKIVNDGNTVRTKTSTTLSRLAEEGMLQILRRGTGNVPNLYRLAQKGETPTVRTSEGFGFQPASQIGAH